MSKNGAIQVFLIDDHPVFRQSVQALLEDEPDIEVAAVAEDGATALKVAEQKSYDVVLLDIRLPDMSGVEVAQRLTRAEYSGAIIMLSMRDEDEVRNLLPPGVRFASKADAPLKLPDIVREAAGRSSTA